LPDAPVCRAWWPALGVRTGVWDRTYWWCVPLLLLQFATFYGFSVLLAVMTRSTVACIFDSLLFWLIAWGVDYGRVTALGAAESQSLAPATQALAEAAYWVSPKPIDSGRIQFNALDAHQHFAQPVVFVRLESRQGLSLGLFVLSSVLLSAVFLALSAYELNAKDY
jgi:hypothetical protein